MKKVFLQTVFCTLLVACSGTNKHVYFSEGTSQRIIEIGGYNKGDHTYWITEDVVSGKEFTVEAVLAFESEGFSNASFILANNYLNFDSRQKGNDEPMIAFTGPWVKEPLFIGKSSDWFSPGTQFALKVISTTDAVCFLIDGKELYKCANEAKEPARMGFRSGNRGMKITGLSLEGNVEQGEKLTHLFKSGTEGYHTFRIPAIEVSNKGTILAFAEGRVNASHDAGEINLVLKRSEDGGKTWEKTILVLQDEGNTTGNVTPIIDRETGRIFVLSTWNLGNDYEWQIIDGKSKDTRRIFITYSDDDGLTWAPAKEITEDVKRPDWTWYATGPCHGIQIQRGDYKGRLVVPCDHIERDSKKYYSHIIYSDDRGQTWKLGGRTPIDMVNECTVAELEDGSLILNMRNYDPSKRTRKVSVSKDGGLTWSELRADDTLVEPICQAGMHRYSFQSEGTGRLLFTNPASTKSRSNMTLRISYDDGLTWGKSNVIYEGPSAYSDVIRLPNGNIACLYEAGYIHPYEGIVYCEIPLDEMEK